jgi:polysaccharide deacetylase family protein (PEP-CTERM system associated)
MTALLNALTVDVEDYFQVSAFERHVRREDWGGFPSRVAANTQRLLELLAVREIRGTFFVLGWVAERCPTLVRAIHAAGHEIGSHSYWHRLVYEQTPQEFRRDLRRSRDVLEAIIGQGVTAYRAPSFSITRRSLWALEILAQEGFTLDSSIFPIRHDRYGVAGANPAIHEVRTPSGTLTEFPPSVATIGGINLPVGGGYFRLYPWWMTERLLQRINTIARRPFIFYVHPWELDPDQPRVPAASLRSRLRHYLNLHHTVPRLERLLARFRLAPVGEVLQAASTTAGQDRPRELCEL